jgi:hypothetical protein
MKLRIALLAAAFVCSSAAPPSAPTASTSKVAELAKRTPGKPQRCINGQSGLVFRTADADPHLLLYDDGKTIWASNLGPGCGFEPGQTAVPDATASYYCRGDFVQAGSRETVLPFGRHCVLGEFTPYRK